MKNSNDAETKVTETPEPDLPPAVVPSFKLGWDSSQSRDPGGA